MRTPCVTLLGVASCLAIGAVSGATDYFVDQARGDGDRKRDVLDYR